ncbi:hypothetical protein Lal_00014661, partial [Lupinus albus]
RAVVPEAPRRLEAGGVGRALHLAVALHLVTRGDADAHIGAAGWSRPCRSRRVGRTLHRARRCRWLSAWPGRSRRPRRRCRASAGPAAARRVIVFMVASPSILSAPSVEGCDGLTPCAGSRSLSGRSLVLFGGLIGTPLADSPLGPAGALRCEQRGQTMTRSREPRRSPSPRPRNVTGVPDGRVSSRPCHDVLPLPGIIHGDANGSAPKPKAVCRSLREVRCPFWPRTLPSCRPLRTCSVPPGASQARRTAPPYSLPHRGCDDRRAAVLQGREPAEGRRLQVPGRLQCYQRPAGGRAPARCHRLFIGNHAQAIALASRLLGVPAVIVMPEDAPREGRGDARLMGPSWPAAPWRPRKCRPGSRSTGSSLRRATTGAARSTRAGWSDPGAAHHRGRGADDLSRAPHLPDHPRARHRHRHGQRRGTVETMRFFAPDEARGGAHRMPRGGGGDARQARCRRQAGRHRHQRRQCRHRDLRPARRTGRVNPRAMWTRTAGMLILVRTPHVPRALNPFGPERDDEYELQGSLADRSRRRSDQGDHGAGRQAGSGPACRRAEWRLRRQ